MTKMMKIDLDSELGGWARDSARVLVTAMVNQTEAAEQFLADLLNERAQGVDGLRAMLYLNAALAELGMVLASAGAQAWQSPNSYPDATAPEWLKVVFTATARR